VTLTGGSTSAAQASSGQNSVESFTPECSRAGCTAPAEWNVNWRNPRIHGPERVKVWLACAEHREFLEGYLSSRGFPVLTTNVWETLERVPDATQ